MAEPTTSAGVRMGQRKSLSSIPKKGSLPTRCRFSASGKSNSAIEIDPTDRQRLSLLQPPFAQVELQGAVMKL